MKATLFFLLSILFVNIASAQYSLQPAFPNLPAFSGPLEMQNAGDATNRIFVVEQKGKIYVFNNDAAVSTRKVFVDLTTKASQDGGETGLLGLAFHPNFKTNGFFYVNYTASVSGQLTSFISRFHVNPSTPDAADISSEQILLTLNQPFANHNGGHLAFGNDGYLYASFGDGGAGGDPFKNGQNLSVFLGKILRFDVDHEANGNHYAIPPDNPFANNTQGFKKEIYSYGMRNTWKFSFDHTTGRLWAGDVGQDKFEEVDTISNGGNYGWNIMEGFHRYNNSTGDTTQMILPLWEYPHTNGNVSITGGYVYRGTSIPSLIGKYIYGDYGSGRVWALSYEGLKSATNQLIIDKTSLNLSSFGEDQNKELYFVSYGDGKLYKLSSSEIVDSKPPRFINHLHPGIDTTDVMDNQSNDLGLQSFSWSGLYGTDTTMFSVILDSPIAGCNADRNVHHIIVNQLDVVIGGCLRLAFTDCAGNKSYDTLCYASHTLKVDPNLSIDPVAIGDSSMGFVYLTILPDDGSVFVFDSIYFRPASKAFELVGAVPSSSNPFLVGQEKIEVKFKPVKIGADSVLLVLHAKGTVDSIHSYVVHGIGKESSSVNSSLLKENNIAISPNPFKDHVYFTFSNSEYGSVKLILFDILGKEILRLIDQPEQQGVHTLDFDGSKLPSGSYILRLQCPGDVVSKKIIKE